jgi:3-oxoacyl-[acyl-carrier protein] reductase
MRVVVTGGGSGIGEAICERFAADSAQVEILDIDTDGAERVAGKVGGTAHTVDVSDSSQVNAAFERIAANGPVDVLVNNAGIGGEDETRHSFDLAVQQMQEAGTGQITTLMDTTMIMTDEQWRRMIAVHLDGTFFCTRAVLRGMVDRGSGSIVNISSIDGIIGVNTVAPGYVYTPAFEKFITPMVEGAVKLQTPMARVAQASEIADVVAFLSSDAASFITGQTISPNGGFVVT